MGVKEDAVRKIEEQQKELKKQNAAWYVGEQLKELAERQERWAELIAQDLNNKEMGLAAAEKKIREWADKHRTGNVAVVPPEQAEKILRQFYGLPEAAAPAAAPAEERGILDLADFL